MLILRQPKKNKFYKIKQIFKAFNYSPACPIDAREETSCNSGRRSFQGFKGYYLSLSDSVKIKFKSVLSFFSLKKFLTTVVAFMFFLNFLEIEAFARAGGRSSFSGRRSSTSYYNQGSRGSKTYEGGSSASGKKYAPMQKSETKRNSNNSDNSANSNYTQNQQPNRASNFFQRHPFLTTFGAALAGSWLGHMIFGSAGFGAYTSGSGLLINLLLMALGAFLVITLVKRFTRNNTNFHSSNFSDKENFAQQQVVKITLPDSERKKFTELLIEIQTAWSNQDMVTLKKTLTPEMSQYFSDLLSQNTSQGIANKVEDIEVTMLEISESWQEGEIEYATVVIEWSAYDYMIDLGKDSFDPNYIVEGGNKNLVINSESWTFLRFGPNGNWILSAIAQV